MNKNSESEYSFETKIPTPFEDKGFWWAPGDTGQNPKHLGLQNVKCKCLVQKPLTQVYSILISHESPDERKENH